MANASQSTSDFKGDHLSVKMFGAVGDGVADDTAAIRSAISALSNGGSLYFPSPAAYYRVSGGVDIDSKEGVRIYGNGAEIRFAAGTVDTPYMTFPNFAKDSIFRALTCRGLIIEGLTLNGNITNRTAHASTETQNSCIAILSCGDVWIRDNYLTEGMTDGVLIGTTASRDLCTNVHIERNRITKCRRNNISAVAQDGLWIVKNTIEDAGVEQGVNPKANIDVEPDYNDTSSRNVHIEGNTLTGATGAYSLTCGGTGTDGLSVLGNIIRDNSLYGINFDSYGTGGNNRNVTVSGNIVTDNTGPGIRVVGTNADMISANIIRANQVGLAVFLPDGLVIADNVIEDNDYCGISMDPDPTLGFKRLTVTGNRFRHNFTARGVSDGATGNAGIFVSFNSDSVLELDSNSLSNDAGHTPLMAGFTMYGTPAIARANNTRGENLANGNLMLYGVSKSFSGHGNWSENGTARFKAQATGEMNFSENLGGGRLMIGDRYIYYTATGSAPTTGAWLVGDVVLNNQAPTAGSPIGYICTVAGSPGTWKSFGTIDLYASTNIFTGINQFPASGVFIAGGAAGNLRITSGSGAPSALLDPGSLYLRTDATTGNALYVREGSAWVLAGALPNVGTPGTYTKVTTDAQGRVSSGTTLTTGDLPAGVALIGSTNLFTGINQFPASGLFVAGGSLGNLRIMSGAGAPSALIDAGSLYLRTDATAGLGLYVRDSSGWTLAGSLPATGTAGTYTKVTTDAQGRVSSGTSATAADVGALETSQHNQFYSSRASSIGTQTVSSLAAGRYLVSVNLGATASGTGSLQWTFSWVSGGVTRTITAGSNSLTSALTTSGLVGTYLINVDASTNFTYATTYASSGSYEFSIALTKL